jgi:type I restriction enzyme R subunit
VPIYYESRLARVELPDEEKPKIDAEIDELTEDEATTEQERIKRKWATVEALVGSKKRLAMVAADLVRHFEDRVAAMEGKAMVVCMSLPNLRGTIRSDCRASARLAYGR